MIKKVATTIIIIIALAIIAFITTQYRRRGSDSATAVEGIRVRESNRKITTPRFIKQASGTAAKTPEEESGNQVSEVKETPTPEEVPTAQSSDDEIRKFLAWLSSLDRKASSDEVETEDSDAEDEGLDHDGEKVLIESVIREKWKKGYETYDIERYMSAIWENDFFYTSDIGTPNDPSDDVIFRGGQQERESATRVFNRFTEGIELNLSPRSDVEFLSDTMAMVEYDYEAKFSQVPTPESRFEMIYSSGNMVIILERRENTDGTGEWRILEWYDYAQK